MNIQARNLQKKTRAKHAAGGSLGMKIWVVFNIIVMLGAIFLVANYRISLNQDIAGLERETSRYERKVHQLEREIETLRIKREKLCSWDHVRVRIAKLGLSLRMPEPYQVQRLAVAGNAVNTPGSSDKVAMSER